jgi:hypothetical protein
VNKKKLLPDKFDGPTQAYGASAFLRRMCSIGPIRDRRSAALLPALGHRKLINVYSACLLPAHACRLFFLGYNLGPRENAIGPCKACMQDLTVAHSRCGPMRAFRSAAVLLSASIVGPTRACVATIMCAMHHFMGSPQLIFQVPCACNGACRTVDQQLSFELWAAAARWN